MGEEIFQLIAVPEMHGSGSTLRELPSNQERVASWDPHAQPCVSASASPAISKRSQRVYINPSSTRIRSDQRTDIWI